VDDLDTEKLRQFGELLMFQQALQPAAWARGTRFSRSAFWPMSSSPNFTKCDTSPGLAPWSMTAVVAWRHWATSGSSFS